MDLDTQMVIHGFLQKSFDLQRATLLNTEPVLYPLLFQAFVQNLVDLWDGEKANAINDVDFFFEMYPRSKDSAREFAVLMKLWGRIGTSFRSSLFLLSAIFL